MSKKSFWSIIFFIAMLWSSRSIAQDDDLISQLKNQLKNTSSDSNRIALYFKLSTAYNPSNYRKCIAYGDSCIFLSLKTKNYKYLADCLNNTGAIFYVLGNYEKSLERLYQALNLAELNGNKRIKAFAIDNIGNALQALKKYELALEYQEKSLQLGIELNDNFSIGGSLINIGNSYYFLKDTAKALQYYNKAIEIGNKCNNELILGYAFNGAAQVYFDRGQYTKSLDYNFKSLDLLKKNNDIYGYVTSLLSIGSNYHALKDYKNSVSYFKIAINDAKLYATPVKLNQCYQELSESYAMLGNMKEAFIYQKLYAQYKDTLYDEKSLEKMSEMTAKYETEKKVTQINLLNKEKILKQEAYKHQTYVKNSFIIGFLVLGILSFLLFNRYNVKHKANKILQDQKKEIEIKNEKLEQQKEEISSQLEQIQEQKNKLLLLNQELYQQKEEIIAQRDEIEKQKNIALNQRDLITEQKKHITDSIRYARRIQTAVLHSPDSLNLLFKDAFILNRPKDIVSGDFYWIHLDKNYHNPIQTENRKWIYIAAADCTGHGVPGALMSLFCHNLLDKVFSENPQSMPNQILNNVGRKIAEKLKLRNEDFIVHDGMDIAICAIDKSNLELYFAGIKNPLYIVRENQIIELKADYHPLAELHGGNFEGYKLQSLKLKPNDCLYMFSDGYCDQFDYTKNRKFSRKKFKELLLNIAEYNMQTQLETLNNSINIWKGNTEQIDDILILGIKI